MKSALSKEELKPKEAPKKTQGKPKPAGGMLPRNRNQSPGESKYRGGQG